MYAIYIKIYILDRNLRNKVEWKVRGIVGLVGTFSNAATPGDGSLENTVTYRESEARRLPGTRVVGQAHSFEFRFTFQPGLTAKSTANCQETR